MDKLFMIGMGGSIQGANIEVHDMQLILADSLEDSYQVAKQRWYGDRLHIDSYTEIQYIDGYKIDFSKESEQNVYMVVYGGYQEGVVDELHEYHFVLASSKQEAKRIGKTLFQAFPKMDHVDAVVDVFENTGKRFGLIPGDYSFSDNLLTHTFIKLIK